jgi:hypothetical protein
VVKQGGHIQQNLEQDQLGKAHTDQHDDGWSKKCGKDKLAGMKPERRGRIHLGVRMVGSVEPPQQFEVVISQMPPVHPYIEEHEDKNEFRGSRELELVGKAPAIYFPPMRSPQPSAQPKKNLVRRPFMIAAIK